jgi:hypothetical protein
MAAGESAYLHHGVYGVIIMDADLRTTPELSHSTVIPCEKCGGAATLEKSALQVSDRAMRETRTFKCESCGHKSTRIIER